MADETTTQITPVGVLVVDDDNSFRRVTILRLKSVLKNTNPVFEAGSLKDARAILLDPEKRKAITLVLLDQHLPDGLGHTLLSEGLLRGLAVLAMSSDDSPSIPADSVAAGATFFLPKTKIADAIFAPLIVALLERRQVEERLESAEKASLRLGTIQTLVSTLQHEINNPLGVVMGATYLLRQHQGLTGKDQEALALVEQSAQRIHHVLQELSNAATLEEVTKADQAVYQIPGDPTWNK